jgi:hypothetical protein
MGKKCRKKTKMFSEKKKQNKRFKFSNELVMNFLEKIISTLMAENTVTEYFLRLTESDDLGTDLFYNKTYGFLIKKLTQ